jgi:hypothetical protein
MRRSTGISFYLTSTERYIYPYAPFYLTSRYHLVGLNCIYLPGISKVSTTPLWPNIKVSAHFIIISRYLVVLLLTGSSHRARVAIE